MIKPASTLKVIFGLTIFVFLSIPLKFVQLAALTLIFVITVSYVWARTLAKNISVEREEAEIRTVSFEKLTISFTVINKSRLPAFMCYILDNIPYLHVFDKQNERLIMLHGYEKRTFFSSDTLQIYL